MKKIIVLLTICICFLVLCFPKIYLEIEFKIHDNNYSESADNITFNLPEFDNQIIYNIYSKHFFIGNRYEEINIEFSGERRQKGNKIFCESEDEKFIIEAKDNKLCLINNKGKNVVYDLNAPYVNQFFIFGMGLRQKYILYKNKDNSYNLYGMEEKCNILENIIHVDIDAEHYLCTGQWQNRLIEVYENKNGIYVNLDSEVYILDESQYINIPEFNGKYANILRLSFNEAMVNITKTGPKPNFITYDKPFYRDAAYIGMLCKETENLSQITPWINNMTEIYDLQRGSQIKEPDNLGQVLYLQSLLIEPNEALIEEVIEEAFRIRVEKDNGWMLTGIMDGEEHPNYTTGWLKFGLESLGRESSNWIIDANEKDSYTDLLWFYKDSVLDKYRENHQYKFASLWPYLDYARGNFYNIDLEPFYAKNDNSYLSYEPANSDKWKTISDDLGWIKNSTPHAWSATEIFFYYLKYEENVN